MTAVAAPPSFPLNKTAWVGNGGQAMNPEDVRGMFTRKNLPRTNSSSSVSSTGSNSSTTTVATTSSQNSGTPASSTGSGEVSQWPNTAQRKRPQPNKPWPPGKGDAQTELTRMSGGRPPPVNAEMGGAQPMHAAQSPQDQAASRFGLPRSAGEQMPTGQPVLYLLSLNGTFERKTIHVPFSPDRLRIGRQTNQRTVPTPQNGFFDSKVLSRQHAEIWADRSGKIWIRDIKSSNGTFVNGTRLSQENRESEPHELQTADHLELGIDIVSEDQKTVVHHKVAAKVEHAGFLSASSNLLDVNFGDLDPANGTMMMPSQLANHLRARNGANPSMPPNGRAMPAAGMMGAPPAGMPHQRLWMSSITTDSIVKKLQVEMRSARLQTSDLTRTGLFLHALLSKDEVKDLDKPEGDQQKQQPMMNGNGMPFRTDPKTRFSDPPAPPPQQPLPEKPDIPSLKRGATERPKSLSSTSPIHDTQLQQLQEDLNKTKRALESRDAKVRELEETILKERSARESAEDLAKRMEESAAAAAASAAAAAATATAVSKMNGSANASNSDPLLEEAFEPPQDITSPSDVDTPTSDVGKSLPDKVVESTQAAAAEYQSQIDAMATELRDMKQQLELWRQRCEKAEEERDTDRKTLAEMVLQIRRDEEARKAAAAKETSRGRSKGRKQQSSDRNTQDGSAVQPSEDQSKEGREPTQSTSGSSGDEPGDAPTLSRANTITPQALRPATTPQDQALAASLPYASMLGVVLLGIGLMSYINGWQGSPPKLER